MTIGTLVLCTHDAGELAESQPVGGIGTKRAITAPLQLYISLHAVCVHLACHDVHHTCHRIAAIEQRGRTSHHLHFLCHHGLVSIGYGVSHESCILRLSVNQHEEVCTTAHATNLHGTRSSCADAITQNAFACCEQAWSLFHHGRQYRGAVVLIQFLITDGGHGERQKPNVCHISCSSHHYLLQGFLCRDTDCCCP